MPNVLTETAEDWIARQFEFEYCAECGGDAQHHMPLNFGGNWFAYCMYQPSPETNREQHQVIKTFRGGRC